MRGDRRSVSVPGEHRAVSDALGFVFVFAIIISTVGVVYIGGFNALDNARQFERMNNAERAFEVLAANVEDITHRGAPSRATEVKLADATLEPGDDVIIEVHVQRASNHDINETVAYSAQPIVYRSETAGANNIYYSQGAVLRQSGEGSVIVHDPGMVMGEDRILIPVVQTRGKQASSVTGSSTQLIRTSLSSSSVVISNRSTKVDVWFNMTTPRYEAWQLYLEDSGGDCQTDASNNEVACEWRNVERVYVYRITIDYEFE